MELAIMNTDWVRIVHAVVAWVVPGCSLSGGPDAVNLPGRVHGLLLEVEKLQRTMSRQVSEAKAHSRGVRASAPAEPLTSCGDRAKSTDLQIFPS